jgi:hypothetical protein
MLAITKSVDHKNKAARFPIEAFGNDEIRSALKRFFNRSAIAQQCSATAQPPFHNCFPTASRRCDRRFTRYFHAALRHGTCTKLAPADPNLLIEDVF